MEFAHAGSPVKKNLLAFRETRRFFFGDDDDSAMSIG
jgi:hypothetical protein